MAVLALSSVFDAVAVLGAELADPDDVDGVDVDEAEALEEIDDEAVELSCP